VNGGLRFRRIDWKPLAPRTGPTHCFDSPAYCSAGSAACLYPSPSTSTRRPQQLHRPPSGSPDHRAKGQDSATTSQHAPGRARTATRGAVPSLAIPARPPDPSTNKPSCGIDLGGGKLSRVPGQPAMFRNVPRIEAPSPAVICPAGCSYPDPLLDNTMHVSCSIAVQVHCALSKAPLQFKSLNSVRLPTTAIQPAFRKSAGEKPPVVTPIARMPAAFAARAS
jgi:hypothetical protein